jgi:dolichyl-phosphate-mannose--protein O-mannosyl transferase
MGNRDTYEKQNTSGNRRLLKLYLGSVGILVGVLTVYQSTTETVAPFWAGVCVAVGSALYVARLLRRGI